MNCAMCNKEIIEGNFVQIPVHQKTNAGIIPSIMSMVCCDECCTKVTHKIAGSARICEAEIINNDIRKEGEQI